MMVASGRAFRQMAQAVAPAALNFFLLPAVLAQTDKGVVAQPAISARITPFVYASVPLGQDSASPWRRVQISARQMNEAILTLDPNRFVWDGYSPSWVSTRMAQTQVPVLLRLVSDLPPRRNGTAKVYEVRAKNLPNGTKFSDLKLGDGLRLVVGASGQPLRLLSLNGKRQIQRIIPLEKEGVNATPPAGVVRNAFSLESAFLWSDINGARQVSIQGSLETGEANLILDRNAKTLDAYGDPSISTLMMPMPVAVKLVEKTDIGEAGKQVRVFDLEGLPPAMTQKFRLVTAKTGSGSNRLLVRNTAGQVTRVIPLEIARPLGNPLTGTTWRLEKITYSDDKTVTPGPGKIYQISFLPDGRLVGRAEINRLMGNYTVAGRALTIPPMASTRAAILPGSISNEFLKALSQVTSYRVQDKKLILMLKLDTGTMIFTPEQ